MLYIKCTVILKEPLNPNDANAVNEAREMYAACTNTGKKLHLQKQFGKYVTSEMITFIIRTARRHWFGAAYRPACAVWWMAHDFGRLVRHIQLEGCYCCWSPAVRDLLLPEHFQLLGLERYVAQLNLRKFPALSFYTSVMGCNCWIRSIKDLWPCRARSS